MFRRLGSAAGVHTIPALPEGVSSSISAASRFRFCGDGGRVLLVLAAHYADCVASRQNGV